MKNEENQSKGRGNPGGSQSGGTGKEKNTDQLKEESKEEKQKRKDSEGNYKESEDYKGRN